MSTSPHEQESLSNSLSSSPSEGQEQGHEHECKNHVNSCKEGGDCELREVGNSGWKFYNVLQRVPAYLNRHVNYRKNNWISTRELARKLDQVEQYTHHHSLEATIKERQFLLLDARGKKEYRTSHIHGAIHFQVSAHLCMFVRPGFKSVQRDFFEPSKRSPLRKAKDKPIFELMRNLDKNIEIVVYCAVGYRSGWITRALEIQGFNATAVYGGLYKWANEGRDIYQYKIDHKHPDYNGTKDHFMEKMMKMKEPKRVERSNVDGEGGSGLRAKIHKHKDKHSSKNKDEVDTESAIIKKKNKHSKGETFASQTKEMHPEYTDSQGNVLHELHEEQLAYKIEPHQFAAGSMLAPSLKPEHAC